MTRYFDYHSYFIYNIASDEIEDDEKHTVIKIIRDILLECDEPLRASFIEKFKKSNHPVLLRLCVIAVKNSTVLSSDEKVIWLIDNDILLPDKFGLNADFEVYDLLILELVNASDLVRQRLVEYVQSKPSWVDSEGKEHTWSQYELCCWISDIRIDWKDSFLPLVNKYKQCELWVESPKPRSRRGHAGIVPSAPFAMDPLDFIADFESNSMSALDKLFTIETDYEKEHGIDPYPTYNPYLKTISAAVKENNSIISELWDVEFGNTKAANYEIAIKMAIVEVMGETQNLDTMIVLLPRLFSLVCNENIEDHQLNRIIYGIGKVIDNSRENIQNDTICQIEELFIKIWKNRNSSFNDIEFDERNELTTMSMNFWPCSMIDVLLKLVGKYSSEGSEKSIPDSIKTIFCSVLSIENQASKYATLRIFMSLRYVFWYDEEYAIEKLMPIINSAVKEKNNSWVAWQGFFFNPDYDNRILGKGLYAAIANLLPYVYIAFSDKNLHMKYIAVVASIFSRSSISQEERTALLEKIAMDCNSSPEIIHCMRRTYADEKFLEGDMIWEKWLGKYILDRLGNKPVKLSDDEFLGIVKLALVSGDKFENLVRMIIKTDRKIIQKNNGWRHFRIEESQSDTLIENYPKEFASLLSYIIKSYDNNKDRFFIENIKVIREKLPEEHKATIDIACTNAGVTI